MGTWYRKWITALLLLSPCVSSASDVDHPPLEEEAPGTRALPAIDARPTVGARPLPAAPQITWFSPAKEIIAGGTILLRGRDLRPSDLVVSIGTLRPVTLKVLRSTSTEIRVQVPESAVTQGGPLTVQYAGSRLTTLVESFRVYPRPKFSNLAFRGEPRIGLPTEMVVTVANFSGLENAKLYLWSDCWRNGTGSGQLPASSRTANIPLSISIRRNDPALGPTEDLMALSGRRCALDASIDNIEPRFSTGLSIQLPTIARYTIENTWELQGYSTPSGRVFKASVAGLPGTCEPLSAGSAGSFPIGVLSFQDDISFQLRNGMIDLTCEFTTSPRLRVRDGWQITEVDWAMSVPEGNHCYPHTNHVEFAPGSWSQEPKLNSQYLDRVKTIVWCNATDGARNSHLFRSVLRKIVLVGPPGQSWRAAFR